MDNKMDVELLNVIKYTTKDNRERTLLRFRPISKDCVSSNDKFKGVSIIETYFDGFDVFNKIPLEYFGANVEITTRTNYSNPMKPTLKVVKINDINLV